LIVDVGILWHTTRRPTQIKGARHYIRVRTIRVVRRIRNDRFDSLCCQNYPHTKR